MADNVSNYFLITYPTNKSALLADLWTMNGKERDTRTEIPNWASRT